MKTFIGILVLIISTNSLFSQTNVAQKLLGTWQYTNENGTITLIFQSQNQLIFNQSPASYSIDKTNIKVYADGLYTNYPYTLSNNTLSIKFPEGYLIPFKKINSTTTNPIKTQGKEYLLKGTLCSYSSSSGSSSSYSSSTKVYFDGQGNFQYKTESSFSSTAGNYANNGDDAIGSGKYIVQNNRIVLYFSDGTNGFAEIYFRQNNGSISEIKFEGTLFSKGLCE